MAATSQPEPKSERTWQEIAAELAREVDRDRIATLSNELIHVYDTQNGKLKKPLRDNCTPWPRKVNGSGSA